RREDQLIIYSRDQIFDYGTLTIQGLVNSPGVFPYADDITIDDLILQAGGLRQGASLARVDVSRRVIDPYSLKPTNEIAKIYQFALSDGYVINPDASFHLQPYDVVEIRRSPGYEPQRFVTVNGEVLFTGQYALQTRNERLSDLVRRSGGLTESAYPKGASLRRRLSDDERLARDEMKRLAQSQQNSADSISTDMLNLDDVFPVGIDLEKALANPGSTYDIVLREGDVLNIPEQVTTVSISGDVLFPNTVTYVPGKKFKYYVEQAGGFGERARKNRCYIVYMNGEVAKAKSSSKIEPGCKIIVPSKGESKGTDWAQIMSISSVIASLATMTATVVSIIR
ncbi:MAG: SLBB domain-containing protein, partial [Muribaculaceae bacterium]|nr:SLBB domain-containing protein [Muribaculaceae bacterium]